MLATNKLGLTFLRLSAYLTCVFISYVVGQGDDFDIKNPSVHPSPNLNITAYTRMIRHAMEGYGTNEDDITKVMVATDYDQRKLIEARYKLQFKRDLLKDLKDELSGSFEHLILSLMDKPENVLAEDLHLAMKGWGTDEDTLTEILCCRSSSEIEQIARAYQRIYKKSLESMVHSETSGSYRKLLHSILTSPRKSEVPTPERSKDIAQALIRAGFGNSRKINEGELINQLTLHPFPQLSQGLKKFREIIGTQLGDYIKREYSGDFGKALMRIVDCADNRPKVYAQRIKDSIGRFRTNDKVLVRIIALRAPIDLKSIQEEYQKLYKQTLESSITKATKSDLRSAFLALITGQPATH